MGGDRQLQSARRVLSFGALCMVLAVAVGTAAPSPAYAFEIFGFKFFEDQADRDEDAVIVDPQPYVVTFTSSEGGAIEAALRNASALLADQGHPASGAAGLIAKARGDYRRLLAALYNEGHYGGAVSIRIGRSDSARIRLQTSHPSTPGSIRSSTIRSGG